MGITPGVLLVYGDAPYLDDLQNAVRSQAAPWLRARSCHEASTWLLRPNPPQLVISDATLADGTWKDVLVMAQAIASPPSVIVVSHFPDMRLYRDVIGQGAFDYLAPPFELVVITSLIHSALQRPQVPDLHPPLASG